MVSPVRKRPAGPAHPDTGCGIRFANRNPGGFQPGRRLFGKRSIFEWIKKVRQAEHKTDIAMLAADTAKRDRVGLSRPPG